jgi:hypothetical protein
MMAGTYTLHVARNALPGDPEALNRAVLVRDGFSWAAFFAPALWFFWHRHWVAGVAVLIVTFGFGAALRAVGVSTGGIILAEFLVQLLLGLEGSSLRRWLYARRGRPVVDVVQARSAEEAEVKSFTRWVSDERPLPYQAADAGYGPAGMAGFRFRRDSEPVIGLFPDAEGRR